MLQMSQQNPDLKLVFDLSLPASLYKNQRWHTGLFRYADTLLDRFHETNGLKVYHANTDSALTVNSAKNYLKKKKPDARLANTQAWPFPRKVFGKGVRTLNRLYRLLNIDIDRLIYDRDVFAGSDVLHTPYSKIPYELEQYPDLKKVITIHDLIPLILPGHHHKQLMREIIGSVGSNYVICVSNHTRNDLLNYDNRIDPDKVFVSHLAADPELFYPCDDPQRLKAAQQKYGLPDRYFLSLATLEPRKNLEFLIHSFLKFIREQHINDLYLVLAGAKGWEFDPIFAAVEQAGKYKDKIIITGRIPEKDLAAVYSNATAFFFMSQYEGFGLPPLEAMQCGVPTVTSDVSSLPEVVGDGGIMLPPDDEDALCHTMYRLCQDGDFRARYGKKAQARARSFSWEKCVNEHVEIYHAIAGKGRVSGSKCFSGADICMS